MLIGWIAHQPYDLGMALLSPWATVSLAIKQEVGPDDHIQPQDLMAVRGEDGCRVAALGPGFPGSVASSSCLVHRTCSTNTDSVKRIVHRENVLNCLKINIKMVWENVHLTS